MSSTPSAPSDRSQVARPSSGVQPVGKDKCAGNLFQQPMPLIQGVYVATVSGGSFNQVHTNDVFSEKWLDLNPPLEETESWKQFQLDWYLRSYGYDSEEEFGAFLKTRRMILDAGCGLGYKAAWMARLNPDATVVAMDLSDSTFVAARDYADIPNLVVVKGDIANTPFADGAFDFVSCDQVLHHTESPPQTCAEFARILGDSGVLNTYVYSRKALPRELLDEHFREYSKQLSSSQLWQLSEQLTVFGRRLSELAIEIDVPDMPALGIAGGRMDLQRFVYWNFIKCYWNADHGHENSRSVNFDWYAPSTAFRYSMTEFSGMLIEAGFTPEFLQSAEACHTGRFRK